MKHECFLYDEAGRLIESAICNTWEDASQMLEGWNKRYGEGFTIWYKRT